ncbi:MAG: hypothetical protein ACPG8W_17630 [Candidatus Promineifilaceae bacterium]
MYNFSHNETQKHFSNRNADPRAVLVHRINDTQRQNLPARSLVNLFNKLRRNR